MAAGYLILIAAGLYALAALLCRARTWRESSSPRMMPVSVLKPLCGMEPNLYVNLSSLCEQSWSFYQIVFGVRDRDDPALDVVRELMRRHPERDIELVIDARIHGANYKVSNLLNMAPHARHPWLVIADSDIAVSPDYLEGLCAPLADPRTGIVTCLYRGHAGAGFWSRLGAQFVDTWFMPSVRVASAIGSSDFGFGASIALRADTLAQIGGFGALRNRLADDYWLGRLTRERGLRTVLAGLTVRTDVTEASFVALWRHERRWMQTIRSINPLGYAFSFITFTFPMLAIGLSLAPTAAAAPIALAGAAARLALNLRHGGHMLLAPLRDCLLLLVWASAFTGSTARWRQHTVPVDDVLQQGPP